MVEPARERGSAAAASPPRPSATPTARVGALSSTPVKALRIARHERVELERGGIRGDRRFYLVEERGWMVNGKHSGALNEGCAELEEGDAVDAGKSRREEPAGERLTLRFPDGSTVSQEIELGETLHTRFSSRPREARLVLGPFAAALSEHAGERLRLVRASDGGSAIDRGGKGGVTLISRGSLERLAEVAGASIDARRFRMSIEIDGVEPFAEDGLVGRELDVGEARIRLHGNVGRCIVTSRHPESGAIDLPTLDLLRSFRSEAQTTEPLAFGVYGEVVKPGPVRVGDRVELVTARG
jgi:uncharacterized protein